MCPARVLAHGKCLNGWAIVLLVALPTSSAGAEDGLEPQGLRESEVVRRALGRAPLADALEGDISIEAGRKSAAGVFQNPQVAYLHEQTSGALGTSEDYLSVAQAVDWGGRRSLRRQAGEWRVRAAQQQGEVTRLSVATDARLRFFGVLYRQDRIAALEQWLGRADQALTIVTRRAERGDAATYDRRRLERERVVAAGRLGAEQAALDGACARLLALLGVGMANASVRAQGVLLPDGEPTALPPFADLRGARPDLLALELQSRAASLDEAAASRWWAPELRFEGGWKGIDLGRQGRSDGFLLGASLALPLWDRSVGLVQTAEGEAQAARGRQALAASELEGEVLAAHSEATRLWRTAREFRERAIQASGELVRTASAGYEGGELGLLELLDAYRGAADDALMAVDLEYAARRARIELDRLTGARSP